ncbi:ArsR/SmtB family transcription factor [Amycolatopsis plumensis]|uniref:ArsR/SmtB family transcription factor n=1 Tax=Amycolatopsis plumensis TaxID=236508 RepID=UPI00360ED2B7
MNTDADHLRADISKLAEETSLPSWTQAVARGDKDMLTLLTNNIHNYYVTALKPYWHAVRAHTQASRAYVADLLLTEGVEGALGRMFPNSTWRNWTLHVPYPVDQDLHLQGRGLILIPAFFCWRLPVTLVRSRSTPMLVYPVQHKFDTLSTDPSVGTPSPSLEKLIGRTRATILSTISMNYGMNTTELANAVHTSLASASQHASALRDAGLITTVRRTAGAVHRVSKLGANLLASSSPRMEPAHIKNPGTRQARSLS